MWDKAPMAAALELSIALKAVTCMNVIRRLQSDWMRPKNCLASGRISTRAKELPPIRPHCRSTTWIQSSRAACEQLPSWACQNDIQPNE